MNEKMERSLEVYNFGLEKIDHAKQATWFRKTMMRPHKSRHTRTKRKKK